ncbi:eukaryotic membrane protein family-domain-containing protein [Boeremia exigua]|uniref:eukaryotic membrane protein family-domain-containing protein n=1 Tax=Boeremia exigua TaxID=749465 RepID=UPI001E8CCDDA|nr:eukaryotic membrane protein family-domain-containing protein [Boeremia exigua]KAH6633437.1 eukaryotic membrane protein family-domain-containing protein [Boeremia exigua]
MNGLKSRTSGDAPQLPTPSSTPEPDDKAPAPDDAVSDSSEKVRPITRPGDARRSSVSEHDRGLRLSPRQMHELTSEAASLPLRTASPIPEDVLESGTERETDGGSESQAGDRQDVRLSSSEKHPRRIEKEVVVLKTPGHGRPGLTSRSVTTPVIRRMDSTRSRAQTQTTFDRDERRDDRRLAPSPRLEPAPPPALPMPPMSMPTFLSLELAASRPSPLYIYRPSHDDFPYESSAVKYERLLNFLQIPYQLEGVLAFGALACLDAWMHVMTILPLRFILAVGVLTKWWGSVIVKECRDLSAFIYSGLPRVWQRRHADTPAATPAATPAEENPPPLSRKPSARPGENVTTFKFPDPKDAKPKRARNSRFRHRRTKSTPSLLLPNHKADILKGLLVVSSCVVLMRFDASRMYHGIRGQSAIKLYVIYNLLEVCDRLLSALGQDILECLFSRETLDRAPDGRSKVIRPFWMFVLALVYTVLHAAALFYQVITLNVAVNSYSNALLTLLLSNQFVEIKGTVFKKFEKEGLFQITCADVVERFQLWLMLLIIAMRNTVEVGGLSLHSSSSPSSSSSWTSLFSTHNATANPSAVTPKGFTLPLLPQPLTLILSPFLLVLGSETGVDWLKHAYITKFNQTKPLVYAKFFDVLARDYYAAAFTDPDLTRRLGLPVIPLSCLFIRAAAQAYGVFVASYAPVVVPGVGTGLAAATDAPPGPQPWYSLTIPPWLAARAPQNPWATALTLLTPLIAYLLLLAAKLLLGMFLLSIARRRCGSMAAREREGMGVETGAKRVGGWGVVDVDEGARRWMYEGDSTAAGEKKKGGGGGEGREKGLGGVSRYAMVGKRIW